MSSIFVQIASYKDPQLVPTIQNLIQMAKFPDNLHIVVAWQHGPDENVDVLKTFPNVTIIDIPAQHSKGTCWARSIQQIYYTDETYTLCLDSHHRFIKDWDVECIDMLEKLRDSGVEKPLLTSYLPSFDPETYPENRVEVPWRMNFDRFIPEGAVFFIPASISNFSNLTSPVPARFLSAHFVFTLGKWNLEVPYDPNYYFHGEEINLAVRSFTHGYDLYHPHKVLCWHEYTRKGRTKQWDDDKEWHIKNSQSHLRNRKLFGMDNEPQDVDFGRFGFGTERTLHDYEKYSGLCFKSRGIQKYTLDYNNPPNPTVKNWEESLTKRYKHCIDINYVSVPEKDYDFWCVAFKDKDGKDVYRQDADKSEIDRMFKDPDKYCKVWREFNYDVLPTSWLVWPHSVKKGWCDRIEGKL